VDRQKVTIYTGNYDFFASASQQALDAKVGENARKEKRIAELKTFIARFSANASKSAQATSRAKLLDKIELEEIVPSSRQFPRLQFKPKSEAGKDILTVEGLNKSYGSLKVLQDVSFVLANGDKMAVLGPNGVGKTTLCKCLLSASDEVKPYVNRTGEIKADSGLIKWGASIKLGSMPQDVKEELTEDLSMVQWLKQFAPMEDNQVLRGLLGRMLFSGEQQDKNVRVLSGGECQRMVLARMMLEGGNTLVLDEPTNHMDLESIESLAKSLAEFSGGILFTSHDQDLISRVANRILELRPDGTWWDFKGNYEAFLEAQAAEAKAAKKGRVKVKV
jgi:ATPase subunit of ABC transporter with duplicated ATPase domains